jgi:MerR family transcriptional regulator, mercuric resistance operon regulatory protein
MTIGQLAKAAGVNVETIRYYQRRGLLSTPTKPLGGQRRYAEVALRRLAFIRNAQKMAFTLDEVAKLLEISHGRSCKKAHAIAHAKLAHLGERVSEINFIRRKLRELIRQCEGNAPGALCLFILSLSGSGPGGPARRSDR